MRHKPLTIAVTASFTVELLLPYLGVLLAQRGLLARFVVAPFTNCAKSASSGSASTPRCLMRSTRRLRKIAHPRAIRCR